MRIAVPALVVFSLAFLVPAWAVAQDPVTSFDQLNTRLKAGDTIWITDAKGQEIKGTIQSLSSGEISTRGDGGRTWTPQDVRLIRGRADDSLKNGARNGFFVGAGLAAVVVAQVVSEDENPGDHVGEAILLAAAETAFLGGICAAVGAGIDAMIPGKRLVVYRAPVSTPHAQPRMSIAPIISPRAKGVAVSIAF